MYLLIPLLIFELIYLFTHSFVSLSFIFIIELQGTQSGMCKIKLLQEMEVTQKIKYNGLSQDYAFICSIATNHEVGSCVEVVEF